MAYNPYQNQEPDQNEQQEDLRYQQQPSGGGGGLAGGIIGALLKNPRVAMALVMAAVGLVSYMTSTKVESNPVTDQSVRVPWAPAQDVPLGMQAAPGMIQQHGGEHPDRQLQQYVDDVGMKLIKANAVGDWAPVFNVFKWDFHLLKDADTINAFALPGGQIFFTFGLFKKLTTEDQVAGVLGHEIGHVIGRHSAQQMAKSKLIQSVAAGGAILTGGGQGQGGTGAQVLGHILNSRYGREHETQSDTLGVQFMVNAGYNPAGLIDVMKVLKASMGGAKQPEFMSTHPDPGNRMENIAAVIKAIAEGRLEGPKSTQERSEVYAERAEDDGGVYRR